MHKQGKVLIRFAVHTSGEVDGIEILGSSGHKVLDEAAIRTVKRLVETSGF